MRFLPKRLQRQLHSSPENLPTAKQIPETSYRKPDIFEQKTVRVYCRSVDNVKLKQLAKCYEEFICKLQGQESENEQKYAAEFEYIDDRPQTPTRRSNCVFAVSQTTPPSVSRSPNKYDDVSPPNRKRQKQSGPLFAQVVKEPLFAQVTKRSNHH